MLQIYLSLYLCNRAPSRGTQPNGQKGLFTPCAILCHFITVPKNQFEILHPSMSDLRYYTYYYTEDVPPLQCKTCIKDREEHSQELSQEAIIGIFFSWPWHVRTGF